MRFSRRGSTILRSLRCLPRGPGRGDYTPGCGSMCSGVDIFVVIPCKAMLIIVLMLQSV
jgi:hypothetical protein